MADEPQPGRRAFRNFHHFFYPSQDLAIFMGGSYSHQSANETQFRNPLDFIHPQSPRPMTAAWSPSRHPAGIQNALEAYPQVYLNCTMLCQSLTEEHRTGQTTVTKKRRALIVCIHQTEYYMLILTGILDRDQLLSTSKTPFQTKAFLRGRSSHGRLPLRFCFAFSIVDDFSYSPFRRIRLQTC